MTITGIFSIQNTDKRLINTKNRLSLLILFLIPWMLIQCDEDPGIAGSGFIDKAAEVYTDSLKIDDIQTTEIKAFTGNQPHFSAGEYNDPLFGNIRAVALLRPSITRTSLDTIVDGAEAKIQFAVATSSAYGDTTQPVNFELRSVNQVWRANSWRRDSIPSLGSDIYQQFTLNMEDTIEVNLSDAWLQELKTIFNSEDDNRDSLYRYTYNGLSLVATNSGRIMPFNRAGTQFMIKNPDDTVFTSLGLQGSAFGMDFTPSNAAAQDQSSLIAPYKQTLSLKPDIDEQSLGSQNMSKVELELNEARNELDNLPANHVRPDIPAFYIYQLFDEDLDLTIIENPDYTAAIDSASRSLRVNITNFANQVLFEETPDVRFYLVPRSDNGIIYTSMLYNQNATSQFPRLLITGVKNTSD